MYNQDKAAHYMGRVLESLELHGIADVELTPERFVKYLVEFRQPIDLQKMFERTFKNEARAEGSMVLQTNIPFRMICSHHLLPALGRAAVGYIPDARVIGLSKLTRLVQGVGTEAPTLQEHATSRVVDLLQANLEPRGSMAIISAEHTCMACRGVNRDTVQTVTTQMRGDFLSNPHLCREFHSLCNFT